MPLPFFTGSQLDRRSFMGAATMLCLTGGAIPHTKKLVAAADAHARSATATAGTDPNGRDLFYDGDGSGNCFQDNTGVHATLPDDPEMFPACPFGDANKLSTDMQQTAINWAVGDQTHEANWNVSPHAAIPGRIALEHWTPGTPDPVK